MSKHDCEACIHKVVCALWEIQNELCDSECAYYQPTLTPQNEWVSVEERLPEDDVPEYKVQIAVFVLTDREAVKIKNRTYHPARFYYGKFYPERWDWGTFNDDRITHWMPLPTLPGKDDIIPTKEQNEPLTCEGCDMQGEKITPCESCIRDPRVCDYYTPRPPKRQVDTNV